MTSARTQRLIELADQLSREPEHRPKQPWWPFGVAAAVLVAALAVYTLAMTRDHENTVAADAATSVPATMSDQDADETGAGAPPSSVTDATPAPGSTPAPTTTATAPATTPTTTPATSPTTTPATPTTTPAATTPAVSAPTVPAATPEAQAEQPVRWAEFSGGVVTLEGTVPDQATADEVRDKAAAVVGPDNVVVNYTIVAGAPRPPSAPLYVRDSVLFAQNSVVINDAARGVLDLGVALMVQNPQITIDIKGHTDADGTDEANLALSQRRVEVIFEYLVSQGIDPSRLTTEAFGESQPIADNSTVEGKAKNRRVEFQINDLLG